MNPYDAPQGDWEEDLRRLKARLSRVVFIMIAVIGAGTAFYGIIDPAAGWVDAFYMTIITLTTVGYGEIIDLSGSPGGRLFTAVLILVGMGAVFYFLTTATAFILEGHLGHVFRRRQVEKTIANLSDHLIVCGSGGTALYTAAELLAVMREIVIICDHAERWDHVRKELPDTPIVVGDPASDEILESAGIARAAGLVACTESDKENLVVTLSARQLNPSLRIVSRVADVDSSDKIRRVGADAVVSPNFIGGLRLASELIRPTVVSFLDTMLRDRDANLRIDEVTLPPGSSAVGKEIRALDLGRISNALLVACREPSGQWCYNPPAGMTLAEKSVLILLGSPSEIRAVCDHVGGAMISRPVAGRA
ncbi:MAG: potassium channel protein [Gemmatimonadota bacterium]|nr:MAG: potassium channel protein [Gemmatimonadota bacterium]